MKLCSNDCTPCCDFCIHAKHGMWEDEKGKHRGGPIGCNLHADQDHQDTAIGCYYCDDFHCFNCED